jgi:hypothetical protein
MTNADSALAGALDELAALGSGQDQGQIAALRERLDAARLRVLVAGEAKRGKSTLINALLGRAVLPAGVTPLTAVATTVRYGDDPHAEVRFADGHEEKHESFAGTNEREGSEIGHQVVRALLEARIRVFFVTHRYSFADRFRRQHASATLFLRANRQPDGRRNYKLTANDPLPTSFGEDLYYRLGAWLEEDKLLVPAADAATSGGELGASSCVLDASETAAASLHTRATG